MLNSNRLALRTRVVTLRAEALITLLMMIALILVFTARNAKAETTRHTRTTTTTTVDSDDEAPVDTPPPTAAVPPPPPSHGSFVESEMSQTFGSKATTGMAGCKTEQASKAVIKDLKQECKEWVKEQKADLGKSYLGNTCEESCDDCDMSMVRCHIKGTIRYRKSASDD